ncbi:Proteasome subunit alpha type-2 [Elasticomyces elasticus]|nr:Proteasome subunit alpha type-2 [Elasticomyces elasticus]
MSTRDTKEGPNAIKPKQTKPSKSTKSKPNHRPNPAKSAEARAQGFTNSCDFRLPSVQIGPVMTVGDVLAAGRNGSAPFKYNETMVEPTGRELYERCAGLLKDLPDEGTEGKPMFGPEKPPKMEEYALAAVNQGVTSLGIKARTGIVLATEKKSSTPLIDASSSSKISLITPNIGMVYSGMGPDYRVLVDKARKVAHTGYKRVYNEYPPTRILVQDVARVMQEATQSGGVRPYGVSLLVAGYDEGVEAESDNPAESAPKSGGDDSMDVDDGEKKKITGKTGGTLKGGPSLYQVDPSGSYFPWKATAIGKSATSAKTFLEKRYTEGLELEDAVHIALLTLKETIEGEMNGDTVEIGIVGPPADHLLGYEGVEGAQGPRFRTLSPSEIEDYLTNL